MCELSIVIVNWNSWQFLHTCLTSIFESPTGFSFEVIVVDNASTIGSPEMVQKQFPAVQLIENPLNLGFAAANNRGAKRATGRYLLFLNPDTKVLPGTLDGALRFMEQHPEAGIMGCRTMNGDGSLQATAFNFTGRLRVFAYVSGLNRFFKLSRFSDHSTLRTAVYVQGSFLIIGKKLFDECGGFDERFFLYAEEVDLCLRVKAAGFKIFYYPEISVTHIGGGSVGNSLVALGHFIHSHIVLHQKYRSRREVSKLLRSLRAALRLRLVLELLFSPLQFRERKKAVSSLLRDLPVADHERPGEDAS